ncbi:MAG TPA: LacI family DNA-binding transcriptional regulator [Chthoniobacterales bacterium]
MKATIRNVAKLAGVAPSTVSHYLNHTAQLAPGTAQNVERAIAALNYRVNLGARSLRLKKTHSIGLIIPNISTPFFGELAAMVESVLWDRGYQMLLSLSARDVNREMSHLTNFVSRQVDGILVVYNQEQEQRAQNVRSLAVPVVFLDRVVRGAPSVATDNYLGGQLAAQHLRKLGHRQIAMLCGQSDIQNVIDRMAGFNDELRRDGVAVDPAHVLHGAQDLELGSRVSELFSRPPSPTAVFATNDIVAIGAWCGLIALGKRVPQDVSLVGFDDVEMSRFLVPPLTTVAQPAAVIGRKAVDLLLDLIDRKQALAPADGNTILLEPTLNVRGSTGILEKGGDPAVPLY